jgi:Flp pilus assembly protein TadG
MMPLRRLAGDDSGQAALLVAVLMLGLLALLGMLSDSGQVLAARRNLQDLADASARAGAATLNVADLRQPGTQQLVLDQGLAKQAALNYLNEAGYKGSVSVRTGPLLVDVHLDEASQTTFARILGISSVDVGADSQAAPGTQGTSVPAG